MTLLGQLILSLALHATAEQAIAYPDRGSAFSTSRHPRPTVDPKRGLCEERIRWRLFDYAATPMSRWRVFVYER
jgi:hypothetical protein